MTSTSTWLTVLICLLHSCLIHGYIIDKESCDDTGGKIKTAHLVQAAKSINYIAKSAYRSLEEIQANPGVPGDPRARVRREAFINFFGDLVKDDGRLDTESEGFKDALGAYKFLYAQTIAGGEPGKPERAPMAAQRKSEESTSSPELFYGKLGMESVIVFCDINRYDYEEEEDMTYDRKVGNVLNIDQEEIEQMAGEPPWDNTETGKKGELGWTTTGKMEPHGQFSWPAVLQFNPSLGALYERVGSHDSGWHNLGDKYGQQTTSRYMDTTFDFTFFHELTHAVPGAGDRIGDAGGYGWEQCLAASQRMGSRNVDNLTFFAWLTALSRLRTGLDYGKTGIPQPIVE